MPSGRLTTQRQRSWSRHQVAGRRFIEAKHRALRLLSGQSNKLFLLSCRPWLMLLGKWAPMRLLTAVPGRETTRSVYLRSCCLSSSLSPPLCRSLPIPGYNSNQYSCLPQCQALYKRSKVFDSMLDVYASSLLFFCGLVYSSAFASCRLKVETLFRTSIPGPVFYPYQALES